MGSFVQVFLGVIFAILWGLVFGRILVSWVDPTGRSRVATFLFQATEPLLAPVRRILPASGTFDFSSLLVLLVLGAIWRALL
jgi:YggT family protein